MPRFSTLLLSKSLQTDIKLSRDYLSPRFLSGKLLSNMKYPDRIIMAPYFDEVLFERFYEDSFLPYINCLFFLSCLTFLLSRTAEPCGTSRTSSLKSRDDSSVARAGLR